MTVMQHIWIVLGVLFVLLNIAAGLIWVERRLLALWQDRLGPNRAGPLGIFIVLADTLKLFFKEDWIPPFADKWVFVIAPAIVVASVLMSFVIIPFAPHIVVADLNIGLLFFLAMSSLGVYSIVLGGWASNNKYSLLGALRGSSQMIAYEVFMGLSLMGVVMLTGSFNLSAIVEAQRNLWFVVTQPIGFIIFFIAGIAETHRLPFDIPEAESELIAGYHAEYSGMKFGMFFIGEYLGITLISAMTTTMFFGGWLGPSFLPPVAWFFIKTFAFIGLFILLRASLPRPRYDQLVETGWKVLLPLVLANLMITGAIALWLKGSRPTIPPKGKETTNVQPLFKAEKLADPSVLNNSILWNPNLLPKSIQQRTKKCLEITRSITHLKNNSPEGSLLNSPSGDGGAYA